MAADIPVFTSWSTTASSNQPDASDSISNLDDNLQQLQAEVRKYVGTKGADIASAATVDLSAATGNYVHITGVTTITSLGTVAAGIRMLLVFDGILTFTHNGTSLILPGAANITTAAGDRCEVVSLGSGNWRCLWYQKASGAPVGGSYQPLDATLTALAGLDATAGLVNQTGADTFAKIATGTASGNVPLVGTKSATETLAGLAELATQAEAEAGADNTVVMTPLKTAQFIDKRNFTSADSAITSGGALTIAHGLTARPTQLSWFLVCQTAELNYSIGDVVQVAIGSYDGTRISSATVDATNIVLRFTDSANCFVLGNKTTGAPAALTNANWKLRVEATL